MSAHLHQVDSGLVYLNDTSNPIKLHPKALYRLDMYIRQMEGLTLIFIWSSLRPSISRDPSSLQRAMSPVLNIIELLFVNHKSGQVVA
jgi:hypothetical protein